MYHKKHEDNHLQHKHNHINGKKFGTVLLSLLLIVTVAIGGTLAYLITHSDTVHNKFIPSFVDCEVTESFDGTTKSNVNVTNTGDTTAYIRVKMITYRVNDNGQHIGGTSNIPDFKLGDNWVYYDDYYYYTLPVNPGDKPKNDLISSINLTDTYYDADGGKQVIEVMAEAIQSGPTYAVGNSWGVSISAGSVTAYNG